MSDCRFFTHTRLIIGEKAGRKLLMLDRCLVATILRCGSLGERKQDCSRSDSQEMDGWSSHV